MSVLAASVHAPLRRVLEGRGRAGGGGPGGTVLAVFPKAVYVCLGIELCCLVTAGAGDGPGQMVLAGPEAPGDLGWAPGDRVRMAGRPRERAAGGYAPGGSGRLEVPRKRGVAWAAARDWAPPAPPAPAPEALPGAASWLRAALAERAGGEGLLPMALGVSPAAGRAFGRALAARAAGGIRALREAVEAAPDGEAAAERARAAVAGLVGLGPGLTPSGDDLLAGAACALKRAGHPAAPRVAAAVREALARGATGPISAHYLRWAARGVAWEAAVRLTDHLLRGGRAGRSGPPGPGGPELEVALDAVLARGETSGADWAAGLLLALDAMAAAA